MTTRTPAGSFADLIGGTPLLRLDFGPEAVATVYAKLESANPLASVKDRTALFMIEGAEQRGELRRGTGTVVEASSGNTGIALAALCAARGYACVIVLPDDVSAERIQLLRSFGAEVVLSPYQDGYAAAVALAAKIHRERPGSWYVCQHENPDNVRAHYTTTGPEIWADLDGKVDLWVCGYGTGGTLTGTAHYLRERNPAVRVVAVEPDRSPLLSRGFGGLHDIPGLNGGFLTSTTDVKCVDEVLTVSDDEARAAARLLARTAGLLVGISSGAAAHACRALATRPEHAGKTVVTVFPDSGERYLSTLVTD
ncbi:PLP-dependent cysteine synthase family protein [Amycolatopsis sp., V23-08]|uniref:PLP-dependent cysteine synthase family protein n=1 Tax=Amycolatopsis heterodermiae TaxID=3110235 RepID=A0ABU5R9G9_9PSEU|nr:PLP-dependent cysteine synthase family protein [Amycolatopsis sp., V23-08]MEA5362284.1 PLP-dependent cysteine synthase family protein [Amycolatopsis sp., V23-08]